MRTTHLRARIDLMACAIRPDTEFDDSRTRDCSEFGNYSCSMFDVRSQAVPYPCLRTATLYRFGINDEDGKPFRCYGKYGESILVLIDQEAPFFINGLC